MTYPPSRGGPDIPPPPPRGGVDAPLRGASSRARMALAGRATWRWRARTARCATSSPGTPSTPYSTRTEGPCRCLVLVDRRQSVDPAQRRDAKHSDPTRRAPSLPGSFDTIASTFLATNSLKTGPPRMLKVTILELFKRFRGHAAATKSGGIDFQSTFDLGALLRQ